MLISDLPRSKRLTSRSPMGSYSLGNQQTIYCIFGYYLQSTLMLLRAMPQDCSLRLMTMIMTMLLSWAVQIEI